MRHSYMTGIVVAVVSLVGCGPGSGFDPGEPKPPVEKAAVLLIYNNTYDQQGDDTGGAKMIVAVPLAWAGKRAGGEGGSDSFTTNTTWTGYATDPWQAETIITNLNPGEWSLSVTVNGQSLSCPSPRNLSAGAQHTVSFDIDKEKG